MVYFNVDRIFDKTTKCQQRDFSEGVLSSGKRVFFIIYKVQLKIHPPWSVEHWELHQEAQ